MGNNQSQPRPQAPARVTYIPVRAPTPASVPVFQASPAQTSSLSSVPVYRATLVPPPQVAAPMYIPLPPPGNPIDRLILEWKKPKYINKHDRELIAAWLNTKDKVDIVRLKQFIEYIGYAEYSTMPQTNCMLDRMNRLSVLIIPLLKREVSDDDALHEVYNAHARYTREYVDRGHAPLDFKEILGILRIYYAVGGTEDFIQGFTLRDFHVMEHALQRNVDMLSNRAYIRYPPSLIILAVSLWLLGDKVAARKALKDAKYYGDEYVIRGVVNRIGGIPVHLLISYFDLCLFNAPEVFDAAQVLEYVGKIEADLDVSELAYWYSLLITAPKRAANLQAERLVSTLPL